MTNTLNLITIIITLLTDGKLMDFTKYGLEGEQLAQAQKDYDADVLGLKNKNTELLQ